MTEESVNELLKQVKYPGFSRDIVSFGIVKNICIKGNLIEVSLALTTGDASVPTALKNDVEAKLKELGADVETDVRVAVTKPKSTPAASNQEQTGNAGELPKVKYAIAVASGKGGVGKSTFTVNLACAIEKILRERSGESKVGIMDCDIYGPSVPLLMGVNQRPDVEGDSLVPLENFGVKVMSMGFLIDEDSPVVWRGPMIMKTIQQFVMNVKWGDLDVMVIDLPPGTGDAQLSLVQTLPLTGAVVVTTPQIAAVNVARRGARMFEKVNVPLLGVAENMSYLEEADGGKNYIFGSGGGSQTAKDLDCDFLGEVPLDAEIRKGGDNGIPLVVADSDSSTAQAFMNMAKDILDKLDKQA